MSIKQISSRDNPLYKELRLLAGSSQARKRAGRTLLDGIHLCEAYLENVGDPQICVVGEGVRSNPEVEAILAHCMAHRTACVLLPDSLFKALSQVEHGIDLLFVIDTPQREEAAGIARNAVLLDNLQDPGNLGSILRSAAAAGVKDVYCGPGTAFAWAPKVLRAAMGAHFVLRIVENVDLGQMIDSASIPVIATSSHASERIYDLDLRRDIAWLFGNEGQGVDPALADKATKTVAIPHLGKIESMNVAASAAVCFFEQVRQVTAGNTARNGRR